MSSADVLTRTLVYLVAGVIAVPIAKRLGLGSVLGCIVAGAVIGPDAMALVGDPTEVGHVAEFGVVILLFLIGLEVRPAVLWQMKTTIFGLGAAQMVGVSLLITAAARLAGLPISTAWAVSVILAMSSTALVLSTLEEKGQRSQPAGQACFGVLLFQDLSIIPLFVALPLIAGGPLQADTVIAGPPAWFKALAVLLALAAVIFGARYAIRPLFRFIASTRSREVFTAAALMIVVGVAALMTRVGLSPALGAFIAGVVLAETEFRRELESDIEPFRGLLLGLFFITVGAGLDLGLVHTRAVLIITIAIAMMIGKTAVMYAAARLFGYPARIAAAIAAALSQGGEFAFVLIAFASSQGILPAPIGTILPAVIAVSMLFSPAATILQERIADRIRGAANRHREAGPFEEKPEVIIAGFGRFGQIAGRLIQANGHRLSVMDSDLGQIELLRKFGRHVSFGDATRLDLLRAAGAETARMLIVAIDDREQALKLVEIAKASFPDLTIMARAWDRRHAYELLQRGADHIESETYESSLLLGREALKRLGHRAHRAHRAAALFRMHDRALFARYRPAEADETGFVRASQQTLASLQQLLAADIERDLDGNVSDEEWSTRALYQELAGGVRSD